MDSIFGWITRPDENVQKLLKEIALDYGRGSVIDIGNPPPICYVDENKKNSVLSTQAINFYIGMFEQSIKLIESNSCPYPSNRTIDKKTKDFLKKLITILKKYKKILTDGLKKSKITLISNLISDLESLLTKIYSLCKTFLERYALKDKNGSFSVTSGTYNLFDVINKLSLAAKISSDHIKYVIITNNVGGITVNINYKAFGIAPVKEGIDRKTNTEKKLKDNTEKEELRRIKEANHKIENIIKEIERFSKTEKDMSKTFMRLLSNIDRYTNIYTKYILDNSDKELIAFSKETFIIFEKKINELRYNAKNVLKSTRPSSDKKIPVKPYKSWIDGKEVEIKELKEEGKETWIKNFSTGLLDELKRSCNDCLKALKNLIKKLSTKSKESEYASNIRDKENSIKIKKEADNKLKQINEAFSNTLSLIDKKSSLVSKKQSTIDKLGIVSGLNSEIQEINKTYIRFMEKTSLMKYDIKEISKKNNTASKLNWIERAAYKLAPLEEIENTFNKIYEELIKKYKPTKNINRTLIEKATRIGDAFDQYQKKFSTINTKATKYKGENIENVKKSSSELNAIFEEFKNKVNLFVKLITEDILNYELNKKTKWLNETCKTHENTLSNLNIDLNTGYKQLEKLLKS